MAAIQLRSEVPGPHSRKLMERRIAAVPRGVANITPVFVARAEGAVIEDVDGNRFLDLNAGIAVASTGHAHPRVVAAIHEQADRLLHYSGTDFFLPVYAEVCEALDRIAPMPDPARSFLTNSGTEAVEAAIKLARHRTGRQYVIAFYGSFHGRSYGSVSLTASRSLYRATFGPLLPGVLHAPYADSFRPNRPAPGSILKPRAANARRRASAHHRRMGRSPAIRPAVRCRQLQPECSRRARATASTYG